MYEAVCSHSMDSTKIVKSAGASKVCGMQCVPRVKNPQTGDSKKLYTFSAVDETV
ncbi:MAG: hypothetical protein ACJA2S_005070 [Cyclobacteriaceae bacterium]|jgi:hypothetical protein